MNMKEYKKYEDGSYSYKLRYYRYFVQEKDVLKKLKAVFFYRYNKDAFKIVDKNKMEKTIYKGETVKDIVNGELPYPVNDERLKYSKKVLFTVGKIELFGKIDK